MTQDYYELYPEQLEVPEVEDCSSPVVPDTTEPGKGKKRIIVSDPLSMKKYLFDHYRLSMYSFLNKCRRNGVLASLVRARILNGVFTHNEVSFTGVTFWRIDRTNFYADVSVELKLSTSRGNLAWDGVMILWCSFDDEFSVSFEGLEKETDRREDGFDLLSNFLVPYYTSQRMDEVAERLWSEWIPGALHDPKARSAVKLAERMGLKVEYHKIYDHRNVEGIIFFTDDELVIGDDYYEMDENGERRLVKTAFPEKVTIPEGTIVININKIKKDYSEFNIFHECIHYELHYLFFRLQQMGSNDPRKMKTKEIMVDSDDKITDPVYFMEKQANRGAYGLMLPAVHTHELVAAEYEKTKDCRHAGERFEKIGKKLSTDLHIPHFRIRARLIQLGHIGAKGALNYVERKLIRPFAFDLDAWRDSDHTFVVAQGTVSGMCHANDDLKNLIDSGDYIYAEGHVVRNKPRFVKKQGDDFILTDLANAHVDDCCLRFVRQYEQENIGKFVYGRMYYDPHYVERTEFYLSDEINKKQMDPLDAKMEYKEHFPRNFKKAFELLMKKNGYSQESMAAELGTTAKTLRDWISDPERKVTPDFVIIISLMWELPDWISAMLMDRAFIRLSEYDRRHQALEHIRTVLWDKGIKEANDYLTAHGMETLRI